MKIAILAPSGVPFLVGGAEKLWWGLLHAINQHTPHQADLIKLPSPEHTFWDLMESYRAFSRLDLRHFDLVISTKYPAWMVSHPNHVCYLQHKLRGLYDTYHLTGLPTRLGPVPAPMRELVRLMDETRRDRAELEPFFDRLFSLRDDPAVTPGVFAFPGPLVRRIVHVLDAIALAPGAIRRYLAISHNVRMREDYFPPGAEVSVLHHPSDLPRFETGDYEYLFTASRLDGSKRLDLIIRAFREVAGRVELRIAGTGPAESDLKSLAQGDPRIRFLGHVSDEDMIGLYANALFVPFVPYDEDYGLITVEAMRSAKAVLTTTDAGGVNELVEQGVTGLSVSPEPKALAAAMRCLIDDRDAARRMGQAARERVSTIDWPQTLATLLDEPAARTDVRARRPRILVTVDFPVHPPLGGGQSRIYHLYKALAQRADIRLLTLTGQADDAGTRDLASGLREIRIAKSASHLVADATLEHKLGASVSDLATLLHHHLTPAYRAALRRECADCDLLIASHPYLYPAIETVYDGPLWYEAHNVEADMKQAVLADTDRDLAATYLESVRTTEAALCTRAERILVCSSADAERFQTLYGIAPDKSRLVPNGVDTAAIPLVPPARRRDNQRRLELVGRRTALFMASWHQPNLEALRHLKRIARACPEFDILLVGSLTLHPEMAERPVNLYPLGLLADAELAVVLSAVDLALNPVTSGSGTNLKMLHYAAAGVPILTTPFGNRGLGFRPEEHLWQAPLAEFPATMRRIAALNDPEREPLIRRARALTESDYDWHRIAERVELPEHRRP